MGVTRRALRHKGHAARVVTAAYERLRVVKETSGGLQGRAGEVKQWLILCGKNPITVIRTF